MLIVEDDRSQAMFAEAILRGAGIQAEVVAIDVYKRQMHYNGLTISTFDSPMNTLGLRKEAQRKAVQRKEHPLSMRLPDADIAIIDRAAGLRGRSRTDFVREAAVRAAEDVLMEQRVIRMSAQGFAHFLAALDMPTTPVPEMVAVAQRPAPWERTPTRKPARNPTR